LIDRVELVRFKRIERAELPLSRINVFVGSNNSGKSCILQGIHFGVALAQARRIAGFDQFPPERLRYCPADDFLNLCSGQRLHEGTSIQASYYELADGQERAAGVTLTRGRNGVVKAQSSGQELLTQISDPKGFFSIYVPGLAGINLREEYRSELVVNNGIAVATRICFYETFCSESKSRTSAKLCSTHALTVSFLGPPCGQILVRQTI
jgi:hypothetical protein